LTVFLPTILNRLKSFQFYSTDDMHKYLLPITMGDCSG
jgi:hypothetical protein